MKQLIAALGLSLSVILSGCGGGSTSDSDTATVTMSVTDAPVDDENVLGVYVTFIGLQYQYADSNESWKEVDFNETTIDLLSLQDGNTSMLNKVELPAGVIDHVRFKLDTEKCYVETLAGRAYMNVPSGDQTGFKAIGSFTIPAGGTVNVTADFDLRKSVNMNANGYSLRPTIKIVDNIQVGEINGTMTADVNGTSQAILYAYANDTWDDNETNATNNFSNAVLSTDATDGDFTLPWLTTGTYDLVLVENNVNGEFETVLGFINNVGVEADTTTTIDINDTTLEPYLP